MVVIVSSSILCVLEGDKVGVLATASPMKIEEVEGVTLMLGLVFESIVVGMEMVDNIIGSFDELLIGLAVIICVVIAGVTSAEKRKLISATINYIKIVSERICYDNVITVMPKISFKHKIIR